MNRLREMLRDERKNSLRIYHLALIEQRWAQAEAEAEAVKVAGAKYELPELRPFEDKYREIPSFNIIYILLQRVERLENVIKNHLSLEDK